MNIKKSLTAGFAAGIMMVVSGIVIWAATQNYLAPLYEQSASMWKPMGIAWLESIWALAIAEGILFGLIYSYLYDGIPGKTVKKGLSFGLIVWLVGTVPEMAYTYLSIVVPSPIIAYWLLGDLINLLVMGASLAFVYEKE